MAQEIFIRQAELSEADAIAEAHVDSIVTLGGSAYSADVVADWGKPRDGSRYREAMAKGEIFYIAFDTEDALTCLGFSSLRSKDGAWRTAVYVRGAAVRRGVGKKLFMAAEDLARSRKVDFLVLDSSLIALPFYKACGFYELERGAHRLLSGQEMECIKMRKELSKQTSASGFALKNN